MTKHRSLLLRGNRFLGSALVSAELITAEAQEEATHRLLEAIQEDNLRQASLLYILLYELAALREEDLINHLVESCGLALIDLRSYQLAETFNREIDLDACWATWTIPFDTVEGIHFVASAYYLSVPVQKYWTDLLPGRILWFGTSMSGILETLEFLTEKQVTS